MPNYACIGVRELGKSWLARYLADCARVRTIFDTTPNRHTFPNDRSFQSIAITPAGARAAVQMLGSEDAERTDGGIITEALIQPGAGEIDACFESTCEGVRYWLDHYAAETRRPGMAFVIDECAEVMPGRTLPAAMDYLARSADRSKLQMIFTTHNPQDIPPKLRSIIDVWCIFATVDPNSVDYLADRFSPDVAERARVLAPRTFLAFYERKRAHPEGPIKEFLDPAEWCPKI